MTYTDWIELALSRLPGALQGAVEIELNDVISDFCKRSTGWREVVYALDVTAGQREITPQIGDGTQAKVVGILRVYANQVRLTDYSHTPFEVSAATFAGYTAKSSSPNVIVLSTIPSTNQSGVIDAWVYAEPVDPAAHIPPVLVDTFFEFIMDGVMARMYAHTTRPYSDGESAKAYLRLYTNNIKKARDMANRGFTGDAQNWTFPNFGR